MNFVLGGDSMMKFKKIMVFVGIIGLENPLEDIKNEVDLDKYSELITLKGIYICCDRLSLVSSASSTLVQQSYNAHTPIDTFGSFEKVLPNIFLVFILSSTGLVLISAVNIYLTIRTVKRIKNKDD